MASPPRCRKCGADHWGYVRCENAAERAELERRNNERRTPVIVRQPRQDGLRDWEDRVETVTRLGSVPLATERTTPMPLGRLTYPGGAA